MVHFYTFHPKGVSLHTNTYSMHIFDLITLLNTTLSQYKKSDIALTSQLAEGAKQ